MRLSRLETTLVLVLVGWVFVVFVQSWETQSGLDQLDKVPAQR